MEKLIIITGWAYDAESVNPLAALLARDFDVQVLSGMDVLKTRELPTAEYIIGWSMGGMLAMELLPVACKKLVLISSTARFCATEGYTCGIPEKALRRMILQLKRRPEAVLAEFHKNVCLPHSCANIAASSFSTEELVAGLEYLLKSDLRENVAALKVPTLLLHGCEDLIIPSVATEWLAKKIPQAETYIFKGEGHGFMLNNAAEIVGSLSAFLQ